MMTDWREYPDLSLMKRLYGVCFLFFSFFWHALYMDLNFVSSYIVTVVAFFMLIYIVSFIVYSIIMSIVNKDNIDIILKLSFLHFNNDIHFKEWMYFIISNLLIFLFYMFTVDFSEDSIVIHIADIMTIISLSIIFRILI